MGVKKEEEYFPRGRSTSKNPALRRVKDTLFTKHKKLKKNKKSKKNNFSDGKQKKNKPVKESLLPITSTHVIKPLTYQMLEEGMIVLGRVREIWPYHMFVCLPGRLSAKVPVSAISSPYTEALHSVQQTDQRCPGLSELFTVGQAVVCSIVEVTKSGTLLAVSASLEPALVNKYLGHGSVRAGHTLTVAIRSREDHGYTLHTGIAGLKAFLRFTNTGGRELAIGEVVRCLVIKCVTSKSSSRVEVTVDPKALSRAVLSDVNQQTLQPGTSVYCTVSEVLKNGLVAEVGKRAKKVYIESSQLDTVWASPRQYKPRTELTACVLYQLPTLEIHQSANPVYLTLKSVNDLVQPKIDIGQVLQAVVTSSGPKGVTICLGNKQDNELGNKGFVSIRRLSECIEKGDISKKYSKGKVVTARILQYDYMEQLYNCSLEREVLERQYVKTEQLRVGDRITCRVAGVEEQGVRLALGTIRLYCFKDHSADTPHDDLYHHFAIGDIVDARVLKVNPETRHVTVTMKETLIRSPSLTSYEAAHVGDGYWGTVVHVRDDGSLYVTFYNDVGGTVTRNDDAGLEFTNGQLVKCYVVYVNAQDQKLVLTLSAPQGRQPPHLSVGERYHLVVSDSLHDRLVVSACDYDGVEGVIPFAQLTERNAFKEGDFLQAWLYLKKSGTYYFSPDPAIQEFLLSNKKLEPHSELTCCVAAMDGRRITAYTSLKEFPTIEISNKQWPEGSVFIEKHQLLRVFVKRIDKESRSLVVTCRKPQVFQQGFNKNEEKKQNEEIKRKSEKTNKTKKKDQSEILDYNSYKSGTCIQRKRKHQDSEGDLQEKSSKKKINKKLHSTEQCMEETILDFAQDLGGISEEKNQTVTKKDKNIKLLIKNNEQHTIDNDFERIKNITNEKPVEEISSKKKKVKEHAIINQRETKKSFDCTRDDCNSADIREEKKHKAGRKEKKCGTDEKYINQEQNINNRFEKINKVTSEKLESTKCKNNNNEEHSFDSKSKKCKKTFQEPDMNKKVSLTESGFQWNITLEDLNKPTEESLNGNEDIEEEGEENKKKRKKGGAERRQEAREAEARVREVERMLIDADTNPHSLDQFERAVLARPDDADLWIRYMSHHLQATEIEKARSVARRALQTINHRHEVERLNVWIAFLNLENLFGTQESLKSCLDEALRTNDEFTIYSKMLKIYADSNKFQDVEQLANRMVHKFRNSPSSWLQCCSSLMKSGFADKARNFLQRALSLLPPKEHVSLLCKFALLENQHGFVEQAQTLFEHILMSYPKRIDVWNVYVDMLVKSKKIEVARQILERATRQKLAVRKMKMLFTKWVSFEEQHGTPESVDHVRRQTLAYVNSITAKLE